MDTDELKLAQALAHPDEGKRAKTAIQLAKYLKSISPDASEMEMLKLWKALWFCLWLSDKAPVQNELADRLAQGLSVIPSPLNYLLAFYKTLLREWTNLDQYRVDKFYVLIRYMLRETFRLVHEEKWNTPVIEDILYKSLAAVLLKTPNGPRFHLADIYWVELFKVVDKQHVSATLLMQCVQPWLELLMTTHDRALFDRVTSTVFTSILLEFPVSEDVSEIVRKSNAVKLETLQYHIFAAASADQTLEANRTKLYALHKEFQKVTKQQFVATIPADVVIAQEAEGVEERPKKKLKKQAVVQEKVEADEPVVVAAKASASVKIAKKKVEDKEDAKTVKSKKVSAPIVPEAVVTLATSVKVVITKSTVADVSVAPVEAVVAKGSTSKPAVEAADFIAAAKYTTSRPGYVFKKDKKGLGYYKDTVGSKLSAKSTSAKLPAAAASAVVSSPQGKSVRFEKNRAKTYEDSVNSLRKVPVDLNIKPEKSVLKVNGGGAGVGGKAGSSNSSAIRNSGSGKKRKQGK